MELTRRMKMARFQTFWIRMRKNKPLDESRKTGQTSGTKIALYSKKIQTMFNHVGREKQTNNELRSKSRKHEKRQQQREQ
ncbi:hypothetical protein Hanom_Chr02g00173981 [Helianthus anomalus]